MGQYNEREGADPQEVTDSVWSDGVPHSPSDVKNTQAEIGSGVDGSYTRKLVETKEALDSFTADMHHTQPPNIITSSGGGGSVTFGTVGMQMNAGTTSGDYATSKLASNAWWNQQIVEVEMDLVFPDNWPTNDEGRFGMVQTSNGQGIHYRTDVNNFIYKDGSGNGGVHSFSGSNDRVRLIVWYDNINNDTGCQLWYGGGDTPAHSAVINAGLNPNANGVAKVVSNGYGDRCRVHRAVYRFYTDTSLTPDKRY